MRTEGFARGRWVKLTEAAHLLGISEITLRRRVKGGKIPHDFRDGKYYVFIDSDPLGNRAPVQSSQVEALPTSTLSPTFHRTHAFENELFHLRESIEERDEVIKCLRRTIEDQQTLITFLEETLARHTEGPN
jgi:hypothetical protein